MRLLLAQISYYSCYSYCSTAVVSAAAFLGPSSLTLVLAYDFERSEAILGAPASHLGRDPYDG